MQSSNRLLDDLAKVANGALSAAAGARQELEQLVQQRLERFLNEHGWVTREEFEAVRDMARKAREEQEDLTTRLAELEARMPRPKKPARAASKPKAKTSASKPSARTRAKTGGAPTQDKAPDEAPAS